MNILVFLTDYEIIGCNIYKHSFLISVQCNSAILFINSFMINNIC